ncbi:MAG TPA: hypothetical protein VFD63_20355, partial [Pyrinomonadaceae bacterium]|nr:hypothetical protein [Pyrinomonadaceae bacterium]
VDKRLTLTRTSITVEDSLWNRLENASYNFGYRSGAATLTHFHKTFVIACANYPLVFQRLG